MSQAIPSLSWGHININVSDLDVSIAFYAKLGFSPFMPGIPYLGLGQGPTPGSLDEQATRTLGLPAGTSGRACIMQLASGFPKLDLTELRLPDSRPPLTNGDLGLVRFCLASRDLDTDYAALRAQNVEFLSPPQTCRDGMADVAVCIDPDGTLIELIQIHPDKWGR